MKDIWPTHEEVTEVVSSCVLPEMFQEQYGGVWDKNEKWNAISTSEGELYDWNDASTYIQEPPFLASLTQRGIAHHAHRRRAVFGPTGRFDDDRPHFASRRHCQDSPAGQFLLDSGVEARDFNSATARDAATTA